MDLGFEYPKAGKSSKSKSKFKPKSKPKSKGGGPAVGVKLNLKGKAPSSSVKTGKGKGGGGKKKTVKPLKLGSKLDPLSDKVPYKPPGTGGTSMSKKDDGVFDLEQQFILRMPPGPAMALRHDVEQGSIHLKEKLYIELQQDMRHGSIRYGNMVFKAKLMDLPTIIESLKTTDKKIMYKTADISQMLMCVSDNESSGDEDPDPNKPKPKEKDKKYQLIHGVTPPLKNVRKRRFRKTLRKKFADQPDIEKEVKRLLRMDNEAIDVKWEVVVEDENKTSTEVAGGSHILAHGERPMHDKSKIVPLNPMNLEQDIFGDVSSSDEDINIMDSGGEEGGSSVTTKPEGEESIMSTDFTAETSGFQEKLGELQNQLEDIKDRRLQQEMELEMIDDATMKERLQNELAMTVMQESEKKQEYEILSSMMME